MSGLSWLVLCLGTLSLACASADPTPAAPPSVTNALPHPHLTDAQDRLLSGQLSAASDKRSRADALYAEAMLLPDGSDGDGNQAKALDLLSQIVALDPSFADAQVKLANLLLQSGQLDRALAQLQTAAAANPDADAVQAALAFTQRLRGQNDEARRISTRVLNRDPGQSLAMRVLLEIAADQDDLAGGVLHIEDILNAAGSDAPASAWLDLARTYLDVARSAVHPPTGEMILRTRLPMLQHAADQPPPSVDTFTLLADDYRDLGRKADALKTLRRAVALEPSDVGLLLRCADLESDLGEKDDAIKSYEEAYALDPSIAGLREMLGGLYLDNHRFADAIPLFEEALHDAPHDAALEIDLGIAYEGAHHPDQAQACFQSIFSSVACPPEAYLKLALFQMEHKEIKQAGETLAGAEARFPKSARIRYCQAIQYRYAQNYEAALSSLAQVRTLASGSEADVLDPAYYLESAETLNLAGHKDQLEATLQEGLGKYPDNPDLMNELAYFWADQGSHLPEALALARRAAALDPDNGPIQDTWGWIYFQMGQIKDALPYLQRAAFMTNNDPVVLQHVGDAYLKLGLRREAIATWIRALEKDPRNGDLTNRIDAALAQAKNAHLRSAPSR